MVIYFDFQQNIGDLRNGAFSKSLFAQDGFNVLL